MVCLGRRDCRCQRCRRMDDAEYWSLANRWRHLTALLATATLLRVLYNFITRAVSPVTCSVLRHGRCPRSRAVCSVTCGVPGHVRCAPSRAVCSVTCSVLRHVFMLPGAAVVEARTPSRVSKAAAHPDPGANEPRTRRAATSRSGVSNRFYYAALSS